MAAGIALGFLLGYQERKKENFSHKFIAGLLMIVTVVVLGYAIVTGVYERIVG
jgi:rhomboid protease GluP